MKMKLPTNGMSSTYNTLLVCFVMFCALAFRQASAQWNPVVFNPNGRVISPFGYGSVIQTLVSSTGRSGNSICAAISPALSCLEVSNNNQCSQLIPVGALVSCNTLGMPKVDETAFQPINCQGQENGDNGVSGLLGPQDWCLTANYMPGRLTDTLYQFSDYTRLGINERFGGMVMELYGTDKVDRILQNAGGGVQLSLWGLSPGYASSKYPTAYFAINNPADPTWRSHYDATPFTSNDACLAAHPGLQCQLGVEGPNYLQGPAVYPCADNGAAAGAPFNPIQGMSPGCDWGQPQGAIDSIVSQAPSQVTIAKIGPANFSRSDPMSVVAWRQTSQVIGPAAILTYQMTSQSAVSDTDFQEIPAIFLHSGLGKQVFFYAGSHAYNDVSGPVTEIDAASGGDGILQLPHRVGPFGTGSTKLMSEDWVSACDDSLTKCITVATFSSSTQDVVVSYDPSASYLGIHGFFSLTNQMNRRVTVFLFPYRFDDVVMGKSIRSWIYGFHGNPIYRW